MNSKFKFQNLKFAAALAAMLWVLCSPAAAQQSKGLRELNAAYPLGGSTSYFWVAYRSGAFEKHGLRIKPIYIRGGVAAVQSLLAKEVLIEMQGGSSPIAAWAQGAKELTFTGAVGNRLDYVLIAVPSVRRAEDLKGKRIGVSQLGSSSDFIARYALRRLGLNPEKDVTIVGAGGAGERFAAVSGGHLQATVVQPPFTLLARKAGFPILIDLSKEDFEYIISGPLTTRSFIRSDRETVMNFMRGLAEGMDFYRDEKNKDKVIKFLGEYYRSNAVEELDETRRAYSQLTPGLPFITVKSIENFIANDKVLSTMNLRAADILDLSFLERLEEEKKTKAR
jgi:ABC-type nitrate/sulfonate/bicarbonate transport system substrate-binding protein